MCKVRLCNDVFDEYLVHCEARVRRDDLAAATLRGYRKVLDGVWRRPLGQLLFYDVSYSRLVAIADQPDWSKKTYHSCVSWNLMLGKNVCHTKIAPMVASARECENTRPCGSEH